MDPDDQPSTSKKAKANKQPQDIYPVTFDEFKKYANVEEYVLKEMERAGSEICRINYKIRHKYYPVVYKQFYASQATRAKMLRNGLTLKPIPKFLKENLMRMPNEETRNVLGKTSTNQQKNGEKRQKDESTGRRPHGGTTCTINKLNTVANYETAEELGNDNCTISHLKTISTKGRSSVKFTPKNDLIKGKPLAVESRKITNFFNSVTRDYKSHTQNKEVWKRKSDTSLESSEMEPQVKRAKNSDSAQIKSIAQSKASLRKAKPKNHKVIDINEDSDTGSDVQIMVDIGGTLKAGLVEHVKENVISSKTLANQVVKTKTEPREQKKKNIGGALESRLIEPSKENVVSSKTLAYKVVKDKTEPKEHKNQRRSKEMESKRRCNVSSNDQISDDSDIRSNIIVVDLSVSPQSPIKSPLPRRNRSADFSKSNSSPRIIDRRKSQKRNRETNSDAEMRLLSISGVSPYKARGHSKHEINVWLEKGLKALAEESNDDQYISEFLTQEYTLVDRRKAITSYPEEVKKYIKYLLNLKIQKNEGTPQSSIPQGSSKFKVVTAFLQMTFDEYQVLINAEGSQRNDVNGSVKTDLKKQYQAIMSRERPWPKGVHIKLSKLRKYLTLKGLQEPIQLKHIPPRILSFEEVLEYTNLKACVSLSGKKPPDSYRYLLDLCKKEYLKCCAEGVWLQGIKFKEIQIDTEQTTEPNRNDALSESMPPLRVLSSDLRSSLDNTELPINANNNKSGSDIDEKNKKSPNRNPEFQEQQHFDEHDELEKCLDKIFNESDEPKEMKNKNDGTQSSDSVPTDYKELELTLSGDTNKQSQSSLKTYQKQRTPDELILPSSLDTSEGIIIQSSADSAGQLLNAIIHPIHSTPLDFPINQTKTEGDLNLPESTGQIPPSPNLFQSSGESDPKSTQSQQVETRAPETVYVPCKYSTTFNTEENNVTALSFDQARDNTDPFADSSNSQEDTMVEGVNMTAMLIPDPNIVIKKEPLSMPNNDSEGYSGLDDSVQIIDVPPSEPIEIEDEESTPELLELLLSRPTKYPASAVGNLTHISSVSYMEHFPQGQQFPSNLTLTQSQCIANLSSTSNENNEKSARDGKTTDSDASAGDIESPCPVLNSVINEKNTSHRQQAKNLNENLVFTDKTASVDNTSLQLQNASQEQPTLSKVTPIGAVSSEESYVSIAPQSFPSEIELTQVSFNKYSYQPIIAKDQDYRLNEGELPTASSQEVGETDQQLSKKVQENEDECVECTQESTVSVYYVYVTEEGNISDVISSSNEVSKNEREIIDSSSKADPMEVLEELESSKRLKTSVQDGISKVNCSTERGEEEERSTNNPGADGSTIISKELLKNSHEEKDLEASPNLESTEAAAEIIAADISKDVTTDVEVLEDLEHTNEEVDLELSTNICTGNSLTTTMDVKMSEGASLTVELLEDLQSSANIQSAHTSTKVIDTEDSSLTKSIKDCKGSSKTIDLVKDAELAQNSSSIGEPLQDTYAKATEVSSDTDASALTIQKSIPSQQRDNSKEKSSSIAVVESGSLEIMEASEDEYLEAPGRIHDIKASEDLFRDVVLERGLIINIEETSTATQEKSVSVDVPQTDEMPTEESGNIEPSINVSPQTFMEVETEDVAHTLMDKSKSKENKRKLVEDTCSAGESEVADKSDQRINSPIERHQQNIKVFATDSTTHIEYLNNNQRSESSVVSPGLESVNLLTRMPVVLDATPQIRPCKETQHENDSEVAITNVDRQPLISHKQKVYNIPALLPIASVLNDFNNKIIESSAITDGTAGENENEDLIEVPFLIPRRFIKSLPFNLLSTEQMQHTSSESTIYTIKANLEFNLEEHCIPNVTCSEGVQSGVAVQEEQLSPTINRCQFDERMIRDWLGKEALSTAIAIPEAKSNNVKPTNIGQHRMCLRSKRLSQNIDASLPSKVLEVNTDDFCTTIDDHSYSHSPNHRSEMPSVESTKQKPPPKTKKKTPPKKPAKKHSDFVAQKTHAFRSLPLATSKKAPPSKTDFKEPALTTEEDVDFVIEDASQVAVSATASQILGTDCTYFEGSQLLQNIDAQQEQILLTEKQQQHPSTEPQVNAYKRMTISEGFMARKIWQVNLQWKTKQKVDIEVRFNADKRNLSVCDESAKLLFNFSSATWSDVFRLLREIDHFEYKRVGSTNLRTVTPLHNVLRHLFDSVAQVANVKVIIDSFNPYVTCEKVRPVYKKPLQCLTKTIPPNILSRMKTLKENLKKE